MSSTSSYQYLSRLENAVKQHDGWRLGECLNMIASENFSSPQTRGMLVTDFSNRYTAPDKFYRGARFMDEVQALAEEVARKVYNAKFADVRFTSGHAADLAVLLTLVSRGDKIVSVGLENGGYPGISHVGLGKILDLKNLYFAFDDKAFNIDAKATKRMLELEKPKLLIFGSSFIPFPQPVREVSSAVDDEVVCVYDGSHVMGLLAGGEFQDPLREGCSLLLGSTHKSLPGPQGGLMLGNNEEVFRRVSSQIHPGIIDNVHWNRVAALAMSLLEMMQFGKSYAQAVIKNSQALGKALADRGVAVKGAAHGYSKSHQVLLDCDKSKSELYGKRLEESNIIIDNGGRIGTAEATRMGMGPAEMDQIGELMAFVIQGKKPSDFTKKKVRSLIKDFKVPRYVLRGVSEATKE
ncbi:MAG TPA: aminotransferase class I/II-fold pyridoxal phosphate-dependent enzyme [Nitrososphaerales archaeon]|nr:aminotransferase class I/II-fold pyridoxal phosphate-dependent enzyme [Nitrososphaerales archaeon]